MLLLTQCCVCLLLTLLDWFWLMLATNLSGSGGGDADLAGRPTEWQLSQAACNLVTCTWTESVQPGLSHAAPDSVLCMFVVDSSGLVLADAGHQSECEWGRGCWPGRQAN